MRDCERCAHAECCDAGMECRASYATEDEDRFAWSDLFDRTDDCEREED